MMIISMQTDGRGGNSQPGSVKMARCKKTQLDIFYIAAKLKKGTMCILFSELWRR